ncbi:MAG: hypothetical protein AMJ38_03345, partial [Dehalococcoidia bacterium DG_22]
MLLLAAACAPLVAGEGSAPESSELDQVLASMQKAADAVQDLSADFTYIRYAYDFEDEKRRVGTLRFKKPEFVRIDYETPYLWHIYISPELYQDYRPDTNVLTRARRDRTPGHEGNETLGIAMSTSPTKLRERFTLALVEDPRLTPEERQRYRVLELRPKKDELPENVVMIWLWVDTGDWLPRRAMSFKRGSEAEAWDGDPGKWPGDTETFLFADIKTNQKLADTVFEFTPPPGVKPVVDDLTASPLPEEP